MSAFRITAAFLPLIPRKLARLTSLKNRNWGLHGLDRCTSVVCLSSSSGTTSDISDTEKRRELLSSNLQELRIDADELDAAALGSIQDPLQGYDGRYGKSAIKTYRAFLFPKKDSGREDEIYLKAAASRTARQIDFLLKRHRSHQADFVRHHDSGTVSRRTFPLVVLLDNVRSAFNAGSVFRTADAAGCSMVITTGITPHPGGGGAEKLHKSALGAELLVPSRHFTTTQDALEFVRKDMPGYQVVGVETTEKSVVYSDHEYALEGAVLILVNEVTGVDTEVLKELDAIVEIPMFGAKNSLNIAACAPVILYEALRQWQKV